MNGSEPAPGAPTPKLPVFGWRALGGAQATALPCLLDQPGCSFTTSGRASILHALEAVGARAGHSVLLPTYHCPTMAAPLDAIGVAPRFYAIDARGSPDLQALDRSPTEGVRALLVPHLFGLPQPMARIRQWCDARGIALIEDCAHAMFGVSDGRPIGTWGDAAIGSLTKFLPVPEGGCLVLPRAAAAPVLQPRSLRAQIKAWLDIVEDGARHHRLAGLNTLITAPLDALRSQRRRSAAAQAGGAPDAGGHPGGHPAGDTLAQRIDAGFAIDVALARSQLTRACVHVAKRMPRARIAELRRAHYRWLGEALAGLQGLRPLLPQLPDDAVPYVFPIWVRQPDPGYQALRAQRIPVFRWDRLWPGVPELPGDEGVGWSHHVIQLACHQDLSRRDLDRIVHAVKAVYAQRV